MSVPRELPTEPILITVTAEPNSMALPASTAKFEQRPIEIATTGDEVGLVAVREEFFASSGIRGPKMLAFSRYTSISQASHLL